MDESFLLFADSQTAKSTPRTRSPPDPFPSETTSYTAAAPFAAEQAYTSGFIPMAD